MVHRSWKPPTRTTPKALNNTNYIHVIARMYLSLPKPRSTIAKALRSSKWPWPRRKAYDYTMEVRKLLSETMSLWEKPVQLSLVTG